MKLEAPPKIDFNEIPQWVIKRTPERGEQIRDWFISFFFWKTWDGKEAQLDNAVAESRATAEAYLEALDEIVDLVPETENAMYSLLADIDKLKIWRYQEYNGIKDFLEEKLATIVERSPYSGSRYEVQNVISIVNWLEQNKVPRAYVLSIPQNLSKAKIVAGPIEEIINDTDLEQDEKLTKVKELMLEVADRDISVTDLKEKYEKSRKRDPELQFIPGSFYLLPRGKELVVIRCTNKKQTTVIQKLLRGNVQIDIGDSTDLLREIAMDISPGSFQMVGHRLSSLRLLEPNIPDGVSLPLPGEMEHMILTQISKFLPLINQVHGLLKIPLVVIERYPDGEVSNETISQLFKFSYKKEDDILKIMRLALRQYYKISADAESFLPDRKLSLALGVVEDNFCVVLEVV